MLREQLERGLPGNTYFGIWYEGRSDEGLGTLREHLTNLRPNLQKKMRLFMLQYL